MDARRFLNERLEEHYLRLRDAHADSAAAGYLTARAELSGAASALIEAGLLEDRDASSWPRRLDERLRADGWLREEVATASESETVTLSATRQAVPSEPLTAADARLRAVVPVAGTFSNIGDDRLEGVAVQLWSTGTVFTFACVGRGARSWGARLSNCEAIDDVGTSYGQGGIFEGMFAARVLVYMVAFDEPVPDEATHLTLRLWFRNEPHSLVVDLPPLGT